MMSNEAQTSNQYALVTWLAKEFGNGSALGKKALQKLVYILEAALEVKTGYSFQLYTYGPFSRDLAGDIDILDTQNAIKVSYISEANRYIVSRAENTDKFITEGENFITSNENKLALLKQWFSTSTARELELFSTLHYLLQQAPQDATNKIVEKLIALKPKYSVEETEKCLQKVKEFHHVIHASPKAA